MATPEDNFTPEEKAAIESLRDRGFAVIICTPSEIGDSDIGDLEDIVIERGNEYLSS